MYGRAAAAALAALTSCADALQLQSQQDLSGPWKQMEQDANNGRNLCHKGKQLPDLYVLGAQKCGTTSLADALMWAGVNNVHTDDNSKEFHFFNMPIKVDYSQEWAEENGKDYLENDESRLKYVLWKGASLSQNKQNWLDLMPDCPKHSHEIGDAPRSVLADFTPDYHRIIPKPAELGTLDGDWRIVDVLNVSAPRFMTKVYGEEYSKKLQFIMMVREPLAQMQSAWYMGKETNFIYCKSCEGPSFMKMLERNMETLESSPPKLTAWPFTAMYARQIEEFTKYFDASQFYVLPLGEFADGDGEAICNDMVDRLSYKMGCTKTGKKEAPHAWTGTHPRLEDEVDHKTRRRFDKIFEKENERLVQVLAAKSKEGMTLANYKGEKGDVNAIRKWLFAGW